MNKKIDSLTGFRAVAAFLVFFHHNPPSLGGSGLGQWIRGFCREGHIGVTLFFVLSGFLITRNYADKFEPNWRWLFKYFRNRFSRIYPLFFVLTVVTLLVDRPTQDWVWLTNLTLTKGFFEKLFFTGIGPAWSLTVEESFYLTAPLLFYFRPKSWATPCLIIYGLGAVLMGLNEVFIFDYGFMNGFHFVAIYTYFGRCMEFMIGFELARYLVEPERDSPFRHLAKLPKTWIGFASIPLCMIIFALIRVKIPVYGEFGINSPLGILINNCIFPWFIGLLIWGLSVEDTWLRRLLSSRVALVLGASSYALYLVQVGLFPDSMDRFFNTMLPTWSSLLIFVPFSILLYYAIEMPFQWLLRARLARVEVKP